MRFLVNCIEDKLPALACLPIIVTSCLVATPACWTQAEESQKNVSPALSLETLYRPGKKHDYDGKTATAHWLEGPRLARTGLARRDVGQGEPVDQNSTLR